MLVCNVSLRPPRPSIAADLAEAATAVDATATGNVVFATLVDDPASVGDFVDAYLGEIMLEAASAADAPDAGLAYLGSIDETLTATSAEDATKSSAPLTTWNPADKTANVTLSGSNLIAQGTNTSDGGVRSTTSRGAGKFYFEVTSASGLGGADASIGIAISTAVLSSMGGSTSGIAAVYVGTGNIYIDGTNPGSITTGTAPFTICVAVDFINNRIWFRSGSGNWNGSGTANPSTNTGGFNISSLVAVIGSAFAAVTVQNATNTYTVNFGASAFAQTVPSGFTAWT